MCKGLFILITRRTDTGWRTLLEKHGLHQGADILEKYGIDSKTDLSELEQDDLIKSLIN